jgi:two-component SAPR family response regulator
MLHRRKTPIREPFTGQSGAPRVLIEDHDGAYSWARARQLREAGFEVAVCEGPDPAQAVDCTLLRDGRCDLAAQADVILCDITARHGGFEVLAALQDLAGDTPILRECSHRERARDAGHLDGVTVVPLPATRSKLVSTIESVLATR